MATRCLSRLQAERKNWRKDHPPGFVAKPRSKPDGTSDLTVWDLKIPAKPSSIWAPGLLSATMTFPPEYPDRPPKVLFAKIDGKPLFHPNIYPDGGTCLSIINPPESTHGYGKGGTWTQVLTVKDVVLALQSFLDEPNAKSPAQQEPYKVFTSDMKTYTSRVKAQVARMEHTELH